MRIVERAHAKINWALDILARRDDGYHELDMLVQSIGLYDELSFEPADELTLSVNGRPVPVDGRNLVLRAAEALIAHTGKKRGARIHLRKRIPVRAGLGGGSADCAATLKALNRLWRLNIPPSELMALGQTLGSDVPVCMGVGLTRVKGLGERLTRLEPGRRVSLVILRPGAGLSTPRVYQQWDAVRRAPMALDLDGAQAALTAGDLDGIFARAGNALQIPAIELMPEIWTARESLLAAGAKFAQMSGSGSAVFGAFERFMDAQAAKARLGYRAILTETFP